MYGRKSGYGGYGPPPGWLRGARVIEIHENPFKVWTSLSLLLACTRARAWLMAALFAHLFRW